MKFHSYRFEQHRQICSHGNFYICYYFLFFIIINIGIDACHIITILKPISIKLPRGWDHLPFLALPDGVHRSTSDVCFFTLQDPAAPASAVHTPVNTTQYYRDKG
jgi:hypothetical protein